MYIANTFYKASKGKGTNLRGMTLLIQELTEIENLR